jgi:hypothetical protein
MQGGRSNCFGTRRSRMAHTSTRRERCYSAPAGRPICTCLGLGALGEVSDGTYYRAWPGLTLLCSRRQRASGEGVVEVKIQ